MISLDLMKSSEVRIGDRSNCTSYFQVSSKGPDSIMELKRERLLDSLKTLIIQLFFTKTLV